MTASQLYEQLNAPRGAHASHPSASMTGSGAVGRAGLGLAQRCDSLKPNLAAPQWRTAREAEPREIGAVLVVLGLSTPRHVHGLALMRRSIICCILCRRGLPATADPSAAHCAKQMNGSAPQRPADHHCSAELRGTRGTRMTKRRRTITAAVSSSANCLRCFICAVASASFCAMACGAGYRAAWIPYMRDTMRHGIPCGMGYHAAWYTMRHGLPCCAALRRQCMGNSPTACGAALRWA